LHWLSRGSSRAKAPLSAPPVNRWPASQLACSFLRTPQGNGFAFVGGPISMGDRGTGMGLRKDETALQAQMNDAIAAMLKDGTYAQIARRYCDFDPYGN